MTEIQSGIGDLIARLKQDGVKAGEAERARLVGEAKAEAKKILDEARAEAERMRADAEKAAEARARQHAAELRLAARDFIASFHQRLTRQVIKPPVEAAIAKVFDNDRFLAQTLHALVVSWVKEGGKGLDVVVSPEKKELLVGYFSRVLDTAIDAGSVRIESEAGLEGFKLVRHGEGFVWDLSEGAVAAELARLVDPSLRALIAPAHDD